jgi:uncharacterized membrane protein SpoIIM required for sporulation
VKQETFETHYRSRWNNLELALNAIEKMHGKSDKNREFASLPYLYRQVCRDLALARQRAYGATLISYLDALTLRGHQLLYGASAEATGHLGEFLLREFPRLVRAEWRYVLLATFLFVGPLLGMGLATYFHPETMYTLSSAEQIRDMEAMYEPGQDHVGRDREADSDFMMFGFYIYNNIGIGFQTFASGLLVGLGSVFYLVFNGLYIGGIAGYLTQLGYTETFYPFVAGHGSFELTAIVLSGAAGLRLGLALLAPGRYTRAEALRRAGRRAIKMVYGIIVMLVIAAFVEAFWSSNGALPAVTKYWVGLILWAFVLIYLSVAGRQKHATR